MSRYYLSKSDTTDFDPTETASTFPPPSTPSHSTVINMLIGSTTSYYSSLSNSEPLTPSLSSSSLSSTSTATNTCTKKGRCWACWEEAETAKDPLIRVCRGCKDPDLQYIHQSCINKYISSLPISHSPDPEQPTSPTLIRQAANEIHLLLNNPTRNVTVEKSLYSCTRCKDPYRVQVQPISCFVTFWKDTYLRTAMIFMTLCIGILTAACGILLSQNAGKNLYLQWWFIKVSVFHFAIFMLIFCHSLNLVTWNMVLSYSSGRSYKHVFPCKEPVILSPSNQEK